MLLRCFRWSRLRQPCPFLLSERLLHRWGRARLHWSIITCLFRPLLCRKYPGCRVHGPILSLHWTAVGDDSPATSCGNGTGTGVCAVDTNRTATMRTSSFGGGDDGPYISHFALLSCCVLGLMMCLPYIRILHCATCNVCLRFLVKCALPLYFRM